MNPQYFLTSGPVKKYCSTVLSAAAIFFALGLFLTPFTGICEEAPGRKMAKQAVHDSERWTTTDHSHHEILKQDFTSGEQITKACLTCHSKAEEQFHKTIHWTWLASDDPKDIKYGKAGMSVNNYCISANVMQDKGCLGCHTGWNKQGVDGQINCVKCHNTSGYGFDTAFGDIKSFQKEGDPDSMEMIPMVQDEIREAVGKIGFPSRKACGSCHFYGGGGDGVKHGDLDSSMANPNKQLDVHMGIDGENFTCTRCHTTNEHHIAGRIYTNPAVAERKSLIEDDMAPKIACESCHSATPHKNDGKMNDHTDIVACQSCHIPTFARVNPTLMNWDWSTAGKLKDGKPYHDDGEFGKPIYKSIKGSFKWAKNVVPEYRWFNGSLHSTTADETIDPTQVVKVSCPVGSKDDPNARIYPFKFHRGNTPYDKVNKTMAAPLLSGPNGFWTTFNMQDAIKRGADILGIEYSGEFDYVDTCYAYPITHMVAPRENVVACTECHTAKNSRLSAITEIYLPGRDKSTLFDTIGWLAVLGALAGVALHAVGRIVTNKNGKEG